MYPNIVECFMCTNDYKCSVVSDKIVTQVEYLLPEITIIKRGFPLRICSICELSLQSFSKFKDVSVENNLRLEARLKEAQDSSNKTAQCDSLDFELLIDSAKNKTEDENSESQHRNENATHPFDSLEIHLDRDSVDMMDATITSDTSDENDTSEISSEKFEEIYIKEEPPEEVFIDSHGYDNDNISKEQFIIDDNVNGLQIDNEKKNFQCTICLQVFVRKCALVSHLKAHNRPKYVKCNECNKYIDKKILATHLETLCEVKKSYFLKEDLDLHMKSHEREKFQCTTCNKTFKLKCRLKAHIKIHTGVKDFKCHVCHKLFNKKGNMQIHLKLHSKDPQ